MTFAEIGYRFAYMEWAKTVMEADLPGVIDIGSSGIAPLRLRELGVRLADLELAGPHYYGEPELRRRIAQHAATGEERVLPTLGASHAHFLVCASLLEPGDEVIVEAPGYEVLSSLPRALGARVVPLLRRFQDRFQFDPDELRNRLTKKTRLVLVTNPHNPSGVALQPECLAALAECAGGEDPTASTTGGPVPPRRRRAAPDAQRAGKSGRRTEAGPGASRAPSVPKVEAAGGSLPPRPFPSGIWVVINEVYRDFLYRNPSPPGHALGPRGVSLGSLTKVYGLGETRVGWAIGDAALVHRASRLNDFGIVNGPYIAERIGAIALARRRRLLSRSRSILRRNRPILERFLRRTDAFDLVRPVGGTILFPRARGIEDTRTFASRALREQGVCVVPGEFFGAPGHLRLGIGARDPRRLEEGLRRLGTAIGVAAKG